MTGTLRIKDYEREMIADLVRSILQGGLKVYLAEAGTHGFYTDEAEQSMVGFPVELLGLSFTGHYKTSSPETTGTGGGMPRPYPLRDGLKYGPPLWAPSGAKWRHTTVKEHLNQYDWSSKYHVVDKTEFPPKEKTS